MPHAGSLTLPADLLEALPSQRWFAGKARRIADARVLDYAADFWLVEVVYADSGPNDTYLLTQTLAGEALLEDFVRQTVTVTARGGRLAFRATEALDRIDPGRTRPAELLQAEQSNTSIRFDDALIFKLFRRIQMGGENPEVEVGRFLTERTSFTDTPAVAGSLEYQTRDASLASFGLLQEFVPNRGDAWRGTLARLEHVLATDQPLDGAIQPVHALGVVTARLHVALASDHVLPRFAPEPIGDRDIAEWRAALEVEVRQTVTVLNGATTSRVEIEPLLERAAGLEALRGTHKTRHHGDYHLGQVLERPNGTFAIIDFEGEPSRPLATRTEKRSPLRDVAGLLRSLDYARHAALRPGTFSDPGQARRADAWHAAARAAFLDGYLSTLRPAAPDLLPSDAERLAVALSALELEKAAYEVRYELSHRPAWLPIPLAAFTCR